MWEKRSCMDQIRLNPFFCVIRLPFFISVRSCGCMRPFFSYVSLFEKPVSNPQIMKPLIFFAGILLCSLPTFSQLREIRALEHNLPFIKDSSAKNDALNRLAQLMNDCRPDSSYYYAEMAKKMAERMNYTKGMATAYKTYGMVLGGNNNFLAASYLNNAIEKFQSIGDREGESMALMNIAN